MTPRTIHLYPFNPYGVHGGTLRLRSSVRGSVGRPEAYWWDAASATWKGPLREAEIGSSDPSAPTATATDSRLGRIKRYLFPSTMWESGRAACRALPRLLPSLALSSEDLVILHTTYLAPAAQSMSRLGVAVYVDVHDLVWRAHRMDAIGASPLQWLVRGIYSVSVRRRELRSLNWTDGLLVCGWTDAKLLASTNRVAWCPTGLDRPAPTFRPVGPRVRLGLIGNFHHSATASSGRQLLDSSLARSANVQLVFAGLHCDEVVSGTSRSRVLGSVDSVIDFYSEVDAVVVPVSNGSGMKCKLAEAALAGKTVVTTPAGSTGYPPFLSRHFVTAQSVADLDAAAVASRIAELGSSESERIALLFDRHVGSVSAAMRFREALLGKLVASPQALEMLESA